MKRTYTAMVLGLAISAAVSASAIRAEEYTEDTVEITEDTVEDTTTDAEPTSTPTPIPPASDLTEGDYYGTITDISEDGTMTLAIGTLNTTVQTMIDTVSGTTTLADNGDQVFNDGSDQTDSSPVTDNNTGASDISIATGAAIEGLIDSGTDTISVPMDASAIYYLALIENSDMNFYELSSEDFMVGDVVEIYVDDLGSGTIVTLISDQPTEWKIQDNKDNPASGDSGSITQDDLNNNEDLTDATSDTVSDTVSDETSGTTTE